MLEGSDPKSFTAGTLAGAGSFHCEQCGFAVALHELDQIPACPRCSSRRFARSSIFAEHHTAEPWQARALAPPDWLAGVRKDKHEHPLLAFEAPERERSPQLASLEEEWTRIGRSFSAHVRFDDPTVSRRHALVHREKDRVRILDDRSLNGVFVNGERIEWHELHDGDEIVIGRFRLYFVDLAEDATRARPGVERARP